jgi:hypothetical protein
MRAALFCVCLCMATTGSDAVSLRDLAALVARLTEEDVNLDAAQIEQYKSMIADAPEKPDDAMGTKLADVAALFSAIGYEDVKMMGSSAFRVNFDDDLTALAAQMKGGLKVVVNVAGSTLTMNAHFGKVIEGFAAFKTVTQWNENKRLSCAYIDKDDGDLVLQSDVFLSSSVTANAEIIKNAAATFAVSSGAFMEEVVSAKFRSEL